MSSSGQQDASSSAAEVAAAFEPRRLRQARHLARITKQKLSERVAVSAAAIGQYESGINSPRPEVLERLARELGQPIRFFASGRPFAPLEASDTHFKTLRSTTVGERQKALAFTEQVWELMHALERWVQFPPLSLPEPPEAADKPARVQARIAADAIRDHWGIPQGQPFPHLTRTAETQGILVVFADFAGADEVARVSAFSTSKLSRPIVVTPPDRVDDVYTHRFNLAHEIGHLILHREDVHGEVEIERQANAFAGELLLPEKTMRNTLPTRVDWNVLAELSAVWGVEVKALIYRARELGMLSDSAARRAYQRLQAFRNAGLFGPSPTARYEGESPVLLRRAFEYAQTQGVTIGSLAYDLGWNEAAVERLVGTTDPRPQLRALL